MIKIGVMQGRLSPIYNNKIQKFPTLHWKSEFFIARSLNLNLIEWTIDIENFYKNPIITTKGIIEIKKLIEITGINLKSITADCFMHELIWIKNNKNILKKLIRIIESCGKLKIRYIIFPLVDDSSIKNKQTEDKLVKILKKFKKILKKNDVSILFEIDYGPKKVKKFISKFDKENFGINYDSGNSASAGYDINEEFGNYGKYIKNIHIKDRIKKGKTVKLGTGNTNFKKLFANIKKMNYKNNLILQTARSCTGEHIAEIIDNLNFMKKYQ